MARRVTKQKRAEYNPEGWIEKREKDAEEKQMKIEKEEEETEENIEYGQIRRRIEYEEKK